MDSAEDCGTLMNGPLKYKTCLFYVGVDVQIFDNGMKKVEREVSLYMA